MGILPRSVLAVFIYAAIGFCTQAVAKKLADTWAVGITLVGSAILFIILAVIYGLAGRKRLDIIHLKIFNQSCSKPFMLSKTV